MLLFGTLPPDRREALDHAPLALPPRLRLYDTLAAAVAEEALVLVLDAAALPPPTAAGEAAVPPEAVLNAPPYRPPVAVTAAGGYVMRPGPRGPEVLVIYRRGVWDLPKGKLDDGETVSACALREVREEVGAHDLTLHSALGTTVHGYPHKDRYAVKTTHWYLMQSAQTSFTPEAEEDIEAVRWMPWDEACEAVGYASLRRHMAQVTPRVLATVV